MNEIKQDCHIESKYESNLLIEHQSGTELLTMKNTDRILKNELQGNESAQRLQKEYEQDINSSQSESSSINSELSSHSSSEDEADEDEYNLRRNERPTRQHDEIFEVYREQVAHGEFSRQRENLLDHIGNALGFLLFNCLTFFWLGFGNTKAPTKLLFLGEKIWLMTWMASQSLAFIILLFSSCIAYYKPRLLLSHFWQQNVNDMYNVALITQGLVFGAVIFVDFFQYYIITVIQFKMFWNGQHGVFKWQNPPHVRPRPDENLINFICRCSQILTSFFILSAIQFWIEQRNRSQARRGRANKVLNELKKLKAVTWRDNQTQEDVSKRSEQTDCAFCIVEYAPEDQVVQLQCHKNHIYHHDCFKTYLEHMRSQGVGEPKCPFCKQSIEFSSEHNTKDA